MNSPHRHETHFRARIVRLGRIFGSPLLLIAAIVIGGLFFYHPVHDPAKFAAPLPGFPKNKEADVYNKAAAHGLGADLDGTAVIFTYEAAKFMGLDGKFKTDMPGTKPGQVGFRVRVATLTPLAKAESLKERARQRMNKMPAWAVLEQWDTHDIAFTPAKLRNPNAEEQKILQAISCTLSVADPIPGEGIRATGIDSGLFDVAHITGGCLPLEPLQRGKE
jgi:hypothetical protein